MDSRPDPVGSPSASRFQRFVLPALAFKAIVIGGGYATGRELAEFFLSSGPRGGLMGMFLAMMIWSLVCAVTFLFAFVTRSTNYRAFFSALLGRLGVSFELAYLLLVLLILAVLGASAGAIGQALFDWPTIAGTLLLMALVAVFTMYGSKTVEQLFKYVSVLLYGTYATFLVLCVSHFGSKIAHALSQTPLAGRDWVSGGTTYAAYNLIGAVVILPVTRHFTRGRDAVVAGLACGPLAMLPAMLFFLCMTAYYPSIAGATLPSDVLLQHLDLPVFHLLFQLTIFAALLESGAGLIHAINERIADAWAARRGTVVPRRVRLCVAAVLLVCANFLAARVGLIDLIARGYRWFAWIFIAVYLLPLCTVGIYRLAGRRLLSRLPGLSMAGTTRRFRSPS